MKKNLKFSITLLLVAIIGLSCKKTKPVANFSFDGTSKQAPMYVQFTNTSTDATEYAWDFGDGSASTEQNPKHQFKNGGTFTISLTVKNKSDDSNILSKQLIVFPAPVSVTSTSIIINSLSFDPSASQYGVYFKFGQFTNTFYSYTPGETKSIYQYTITPLASSSEILIANPINGPNAIVATFNFIPSTFVKSDSEDPYPSKINFTSGGNNFDMNVVWQ